MNLLDTLHSQELINAYHVVEQRFTGRRLPRNLDTGAYMLDCAVINHYCNMKEGVEVTNMNEELAQWYREQKAKRGEGDKVEDKAA